LAFCIEIPKGCSPEEKEQIKAKNKESEAVFLY